MGFLLSCLCHRGNDTSVLKEMEIKQFHGSRSFFTQSRNITWCKEALWCALCIGIGLVFFWSFTLQWLRDPLCPPVCRGNTNHLPTVLSPVAGELALAGWWAPKTLLFFASSVLHQGYLMIVPLFRVLGFFYLFLSCSPITLLSFSAPNDRAVREWLTSRGWIGRCNLGGSSLISGEFSAAKNPAGIIDLAVPMD